MQELVYAISLGSLYLLFSLGVSLLWGTLDVLNFAHGAIFMFAGFSAYLLLQEAALPLVPLLAVGAAVGMVLSTAAYLLVFQPILRRAATKESAGRQILIGGIGLGTIPVAVAEIGTLGIPFGLSRSSFELHTYVVGSVRISNVQILIIALALATTFAMELWIRRSRNGLALRAIGVDAETASLMGANRGRLGLMTIGIGGALAGLAAVLIILNFGAIDARSGDLLMLKAFAIIILGGVGSVAGTAVASFVLATAETMVVTRTSGTWGDAIAFGILFLVLVLRPRGIFGRQEVRRT